MKMVREQILPMGLNTSMCCVGTELVPCWSFRTPTRDFHAFSLSLLKTKVASFARKEDIKQLEDEIELVNIEEGDLELFASQDEEFILEVENDTAQGAEG